MQVPAGAGMDNKNMGKTMTSRPTLALGQRIVFSAPIDFGPYGMVVSGDQGRITYNNQETGEVQIMVARHIPKMVDWENTITLMPHDDEALLASLQPVRPRRTLLGSLALAFAALAIITPCALALQHLCMLTDIALAVSGPVSVVSAYFGKVLLFS